MVNKRRSHNLYDANNLTIFINSLNNNFLVLICLLLLPVKYDFTLECLRLERIVDIIVFNLKHYLHIWSLLIFFEHNKQHNFYLIFMKIQPLIQT